MRQRHRRVLRGAFAEGQNPFRIVGGFGLSRLNHPRRSSFIWGVFEQFVVAIVGLGLQWLIPR